jgi:hypothetical protein
MLHTDQIEGLDQAVGKSSGQASRTLQARAKPLQENAEATVGLFGTVTLIPNPT